MEQSGCILQCLVIPVHAINRKKATEIKPYFGWVFYFQALLGAALGCSSKTSMKSFFHATLPRNSRELTVHRNGMDFNNPSETREFSPLSMNSIKCVTDKNHVLFMSATQKQVFS